ncbi:MAG: hypothetical protein QOJ51_498 [Acidobacteriaceae bacterium]|jgi:hypothetical protein|nr:hypothetical protein [Acidobacteriaceae bacterium]
MIENVDELVVHHVTPESLLLQLEKLASCGGRFGWSAGVYREMILLSVIEELSLQGDCSGVSRAHRGGDDVCPAHDHINALVCGGPFYMRSFLLNTDCSTVKTCCDCRQSSSLEGRRDQYQRSMCQRQGPWQRTSHPATAFGCTLSFDNLVTT